MALNRTIKVAVGGMTKEFDLAMACIEAGGSDNIRPSQEVLKAAFAKTEKISVVENNWVALKNQKGGVTLYHFFLPVELI